MILMLSLKSWRARMVAVALSITAISFSSFLLFSLEQIRRGVRSGFAGTVTSVDLIIGPRTGSTELLLATVFHIGNLQNSLSYKTFSAISADPSVAWAVPVSLGDSYHGFRVVGTSAEFFERYRYGRGRSLAFTSGDSFKGSLQAVVGASVAAELQLTLNAKIKLDHGMSGDSEYNHSEKPVSVHGILSRTGTPLDRAVFVSLDSLEALHAGWENGLPPEDEKAVVTVPPVSKISAIFVGVKSKPDLLRLQQDFRTYRSEPLTAILPYFELSRLWDVMGYAEQMLTFVSLLVAVISILVIFITIYSSLQQRQREMAILRAVGATPGTVFRLFFYEAIFIGLAGVTIGGFSTGVFLSLTSGLWERLLGIFISVSLPGKPELVIVLVIILGSLAAGLVPGFLAYRKTLQNGLQARI